MNIVLERIMFNNNNIFLNSSHFAEMSERLNLAFSISHILESLRRGICSACGVTWNGVDLVQYDEPPLLAPEPLHDSFCLPGSLGGVPQHRVGADGYRAANGLVLGIGGEATNLAVINGGPHLELGLPLLH